MPRRDHFQDLTIAGNLSLGANTTILPEFTPARIAAIRIAGEVGIETIQLAVTDAGTTGAVLIPSDYTGTDTFTNPNKIPVIDLRGSGLRITAPVSSTVSITSSSVASPSVIVTSAAHGLDDTQQIRIVGHSGSVPDINTWWGITLIDSTSFSIPVNVTTGGTGGTFNIWASGETAFEFSVPGAGGTDPRWKLLLSTGGSLAIAWKDGLANLTVIEMNRAADFGMGFSLPLHGNTTTGAGFGFGEGSDPRTRHFFLRTRAPVAGGTAPADYIEFGSVVGGNIAIGKQGSSIIGVYAASDAPIIQAEGPGANVSLQLQSKGTGVTRIRNTPILDEGATDRLRVVGGTGTVALEAVGGSTNIGLRITPKGSGQVVMVGQTSFGGSSPGVDNNGGGFKHARVTTGSINLSSSAAVTVTWATAFGDANYTVHASVVEADTDVATLQVDHIESVSASAVVVRVENKDSGAAKTGTLHVIAIHD